MSTIINKGSPYSPLVKIFVQMEFIWGGGGVSLFGFLVFGWLDFCLRKKALSKASIPASVSSDSIFYFLSASHLG